MFKLEQRKYYWMDFLRIPFQCSPLSTVCLGLQKIATGLSAVVQVPIVANFIDLSIKYALGETDFYSVVPWFVLLVVCVGWRRVSYVVGRIFSSQLEINALFAVGIAYSDKRSRLEYRHFENPDTWDLINRVCSKYQETISLMAQRTFNLLLYVIRILGTLYIVFTQVWWIGLLTISLCLPMLIISVKGGKTNYRSIKIASKHERRHQYLAEVLSGRDAVDERTLFNYTKYLGTEWFSQYEVARKIKIKADIKLALTSQGTGIFVSLISALITVALVFPTVNGTMAFGMFIALAGGMYDLVQLLANDLNKAVIDLAKFRSYLQDLTIFASLEEATGALDLPLVDIEPFQELELKNVSFKYPGTEAYVLKNCSMKMFAGMHFAFVGVNGAGKTTIIKLLTGLYDTYDGEIILNGKELRSYPAAHLKAMFCGVYQDFAQYPLSVKDNVCIGNINQINSSKMFGRMKDALDSVELFDKLSGLPLALNTPLGKIADHGVDISSGQWQRLAMARALVSSAPIIILDEPTASLDPVSESKLYDQFENISRDRTTIFISHRLGSIKLADKIFVLCDGYVLEQGTHKELIAQNGIYADMYTNQRSWYQ